MRLRSVIAALALAVLSVSAHAQSRDPDDEFDEDKKGWHEFRAAMPAYPKPENLVQLAMGKAASHRFYIDTTSLSLDEDGVMRYTALVKTAGGATNITFEGIRCETRERKLYAVGRSDGTWIPARAPKWQRIELSEAAPYYYVLYREYFCPERTRPTRAQRAAEALKRGTGLPSGPTSVSD